MSFFLNLINKKVFRIYKLILQILHSANCKSITLILKEVEVGCFNSLPLGMSKQRFHQICPEAF